MKSTEICPKCNSKKVLVHKAGNEHSAIGTTNTFGMVTGKLDRYICINCGYTEEYINMDEKFKKWAEKELTKQGKDEDDFV